jgi:hypothetical protein
MAADIRIRWLIDVVDKGAGTKLLTEDRALRSSLAQTDAQYKRTADVAVSSSERQRLASSAVTAANERQSSSLIAASSATSRHATVQRDFASTMGSQVALTNALSGALGRQRVETDKTHDSESRLLTLRKQAAKVAGGAASGVSSAVGAVGGAVATGAKVGALAVGGAALAVGGATILGIKQAGELSQSVAGMVGLTGVTQREGVALAIISKALNINARSLGQAFGTLGKQVIGQEKGAKASVEAFKALDISPAKVQSLKSNLPALFDLVYERTQTLPGAERAGYMKTLLGRGGVIAGQIEQQGPLADQIKEVEASTAGLSPKKLEELHAVEIRLKMATTTLELSFAETFGPPLISLLNLVAPAIKPIGEGLKLLVQTPLEWLKKEGPGIWSEIKKGAEGAVAGIKGEPLRQPAGTKPVLGAQVTVPLTTSIGAPNVPVLGGQVGPYKAGYGAAGSVRSAEPFGEQPQVVGTASEPSKWTQIAHQAGEALSTVGKEAGKYGKQLLAAFKPAQPFFQNVLLPVVRGFGTGLALTFRIALPVVQLVGKALGLVGQAAGPAAAPLKLLGVVVGALAAGPLLKLLGGIPKIGLAFKLLGAPIKLAEGALMMFGRALMKIPGAEAAVSKISTAFSALPGKLAGWAKAGGQAAATGLSSMAGKAASAGQGLVSAAAGALSGLAGRITATIKGSVAGKALSEAWNTLWTSGTYLGSALQVGLVLGLAGIAVVVGKKIEDELSHLKIDYNPLDWLKGKFYSVSPSGGPESTQAGKRRGGLIGYAEGGLVGSYVSPGEQVLYGGGSWTVPGARTAADSVYAALPVGAAVLTGSGQSMMAGGASLGAALAYQAPHFASGGVVLSPSQMASLAYSGGGVRPTGSAIRMGAIGMRESSGETWQHTVSPTDDSWGLWQINVLPNANPQYKKWNLTDPNVNAKAMGQLFHASGFNPWGGYPESSYSKWLAPAAKGFSTSGKAVAGSSGTSAGSSSLTVPLMLPASRTREGLVPDALTQGIAAGGMSRAEIAANRSGVRGAEGNPIVSTIAGALGEVTKTLAVAAASTAAAKAKASGGGLTPWPTSLAPHEVASWIAPELRYAQKHGWMGQITSGYRNEASQHGGTAYPHGAIDFGGGWVSGGQPPDPAAAANRASFVSATKGYKGLRVQMPIGFRDDGHMSGTGHRRGGIIGMATGGVVGAGGYTYGSRDPNHWPGSGWLWNKVRQQWYLDPEYRERQRNEAFGPSPTTKDPAEVRIRAAVRRGVFPVYIGGGERHTLEFRHSAPLQVRRARLGGIVGAIPRFAAGGVVGAGVSKAISGLQATVGNKALYESALRTLDELLGNATLGRIEQLRGLFTQSARKAGSAAVIKSFQAAISEIDFELGRRIGAFKESIAQRTGGQERGQGALDRFMRGNAIDAASVKGLQLQGVMDERATAARRKNVTDAQAAMKIAEHSGNRQAIADATTELDAAYVEMDEAVTKGIEDRRNLIRQGAQDATDAAQFGVESIQNSLSGLANSSTSETPGGMIQKAGMIRQSLVPALQSHLGSLNAQLGALQATGASTGEQNAVLLSIQQAGNDIGAAMKEAADLIRQSAEQAAAETVEHAAHGTSMASLGQQHLELEERIKGTFVSGGQERATYVTDTLIPALNAELNALNGQMRTAAEQGDPKLADQIAESIAGKQNSILEAQLAATEDIADNTQKKIGGLTGFSFGAENLSDAIIAIGNGS